MHRVHLLRRPLLTLLVTVGIAACDRSSPVTNDPSSGTPSARTPPPVTRSPAKVGGRTNVLLIVADDLGWGDLSCYGNERFRTPALDRLAAEGIRFTQGYQAASTCSPARAAMLTGRWPAELGIHQPLMHQRPDNSGTSGPRLAPDTPTIADVLRAEGYETVHIGKWHLSLDATRATLADYGFTTAHWVEGKEDGANAAGARRDLYAIAERPTNSATLVDATLAAIDATGTTPFYCQLWLSDVHAPVAPSAEQRMPFRVGVPDGFTAPIEVYAAAVTEMDRQIGRLLDGIDARGLTEDTIVIFTSDNGPASDVMSTVAWSAAGSAGPFRGMKRSLYEGGVRVPWIVRWPGHAPAGTVNRSGVVCGIDLLPTIAECVRAPLSAELTASLRGESVATEITGADAGRTHPLFWEWRSPPRGPMVSRSPSLAMREGKWKLLANPDDARLELFDLESDPSELDNLARVEPMLAARLRSQLLAWSKALPPRETRVDHTDTHDSNGSNALNDD